MQNAGELENSIWSLLYINALLRLKRTLDLNRNRKSLPQFQLHLAEAVGNLRLQLQRKTLKSTIIILTGAAQET